MSVESVCRCCQFSACAPKSVIRKLAEQHKLYDQLGAGTSQKPQDSELLFSVRNKHTVSSGVPLFVNGSEPGRYYGYIENEYGEQATFVYNRQTKTGSLWMGDLGWDKPQTVVDGDAPDIILNQLERGWLLACWQAATAREK